MPRALACGTPVVASDIPGHRFVGDDLPARRLAAREGAAFAVAIKAELGDAVTRVRIEERFSLSGWAERLTDLCAELTAGG